MDLTLAIFVLVYLAMGVGHLPGFRLDRTGAATVGAMVLIALGQISPAAAWAAVDYRVIGLLFGLMTISAAFVVAGFYDWVAVKVGNLNVGPKGLLAILIAVSGAMAALLNKDVVAVAMAPIFCSICVERRLNPLPFLLGFCFAANFASAATILGSPQNMIVAETLHLSFGGFMAAAAPVAVLGLPVIWIVIVLCYRGRWELAGDAQPSTASVATAPVALNRGETVKTCLVASAVVAAFIFSDLPHMLIALMGASVLLVSRRFASSNLLHHVNGDLLLLLFGLFVVNAALTATGLPEQVLAGLRGIGLNLHDPPSMLIIMAVLSNIVGNNPAVMLVAPFIGGSHAPEALGAAIALGTGFSSSAVIFGSLVGIIVAEECRKRGIALSFAEFARAGLPTSIICLLMAAVWIHHLG
ncbi:Na+/H+ antiporter NhaD/arsenite permease-like protein [Angulomicrobium tetraedrale]|uniref:Na+/H+ antiporter NhaD/arsenite permease-like protein n=1 Tax=Ancylobacter tetraedralis TaxID=217068 RepID=A0A839ZD54_9HYPH|nr:SLC13 family permease [Ancylobacter tetraedralis]MBB3772721.1 Na+/H+ antiporter NhaD/arsenite permease-like protein [Ancylobacter tetraedralis]